MYSNSHDDLELLNGYEPPEFNLSIERNVPFSFSDNSSKFKYYDIMTKIDNLWQMRKIKSLEIRFISPSGKETVFNSSLTVSNGAYVDSVFSATLMETGEYIISVSLIWEQIPDGAFELSDIKIVQETTIAVSSANDILRQYTIAETIDRLLNVSEIHRASQPNAYYLADKDREELSSEEAPNFSFTVRNLFEGLYQIGSYRKSRFPRLKGSEISFDPLWNGVQIEEEDLPAPTQIIATRGIDDYATALDCTASNVVAMLAGKKATAFDPYFDGYKTTRSSGGSAITEATAMISTGTIYQYLSLEMGVENGVTVGDITPYVYEDGDYQSLSDNSRAFPYSKAYALKWTQMGQNITELSHRVTTTTLSFVNLFENPAIANIASVTTGNAMTDLGYGIKDHLVNLVKSATGGNGFEYGDDAESFASLLFRTTYNPSVNVRTRVYRDYDGDFGFNSAILYNQSETVVDSELLGEHLTGTLKMMGNGLRFGTYVFRKLDDVPKNGTLVGDWLIVQTSMTIYATYIVCTISFSAYADVAPQVALANEWKDADISMRKFSERNVNYGEFGYFSHTDTDKFAGMQTMLKRDAAKRLLTFNDPYQLTAVKATGYTVDGSPLNTCILTLYSFPVGHSIQYHWDYADNYSAGYMSVVAPENATSTLSGTKYNRAQKAVAYADAYGRFKTYAFELMRTGPLADGYFTEWNLKINSVDFEIETNEEGAKSATVTAKSKFKYDRYVDIVSGSGRIFTARILANELTATITVSGNTFELKRVYVKHPEYVAKQIGHSLPLLSPSLTVDGNPWSSSDVYFGVDDLLVDKNGSEGLHFDIQFHFKQDFRDFIIGSGISNFNSLVGGEGLNIGLFGFPNGLSKYERFPYMANAVRLQSGLSWEWNDSKNRLETVLPDSVDGFPAWGLVGWTQSNLPQLIFGENSKTPFLKNLYFYFSGSGWKKQTDEEIRCLFRFYGAEDGILHYPYKSTENDSTELFSVQNFHSADEGIVDYPYTPSDSTNDFYFQDFHSPEEGILHYPYRPQTAYMAMVIFHSADKGILRYAHNAVQTDSTVVFSKFHDATDGILNYPHSGIITDGTVHTLKFYDETDGIVSYPYSGIANPTVTAKFVNYDNTVLSTQTIPWNTAPVYNGTPTRAEDDSAVYTFTGWTPPIGKITTDTTFAAQYSTRRKYTVTFVNYDKTVLQSSKWLEGQTPVYNGATPIRQENNQYSYSFSGWSPNISTVTGNQTYTAMFYENPKSFSKIIYFCDPNGNVKGSTNVIGKYGNTVTISVPIPPDHYYRTQSSVSVKILNGDAEYLHVYDSNTYTATLECRVGSITGQLLLSTSYSGKYPNIMSQNGFSGEPNKIISEDLNQYMLIEYQNIFGETVSVEEIKNAQLTDNTAKWFAIYLRMKN